MSIHYLFPDTEVEMAAATDLHARIAGLEQALRDIQQMSIRRQIDGLDAMLNSVKSLTPRETQSDSAWLENLIEFCERALETSK
jgi:hypothetical protein